MLAGSLGKRALGIRREMGDRRVLYYLRQEEHIPSGYCRRCVYAPAIVYSLNYFFFCAHCINSYCYDDDDDDDEWHLWSYISCNTSPCPTTSMGTWWWDQKKSQTCELLLLRWLTFREATPTPLAEPLGAIPQKLPTPNRSRDDFGAFFFLALEPLHTSFFHVVVVIVVVVDDWRRRHL
jgi:hypothetical protein